MHMPCPLFELRCFIFVLQYKFMKAFNSDMNDKRGLQSISKASFCFLERFCGGCAGADLHPLVNNNTLTQ